jgi:RIO kinase 2
MGAVKEEGIHDSEEYSEDDSEGDEIDINEDSGAKSPQDMEIPDVQCALHSDKPDTLAEAPPSPTMDPNGLKFEALDISDLSDHRLSRSPPQSRREILRDSSEDEGGMPSESKGNIKSIVSSDLTKKRAQQQRKYHSKRSTRHAGRAHGSKAKQDKRVKLADHAGVWG